MPAPKIHVHMTHAPAINFALEQAGVAIIGEVTIENRGDVAVGPSALTIALLPDLGAPITLSLPAIDPRQTTSYSPIDLPLPPDRLRSVIEAERATLSWRLTTGEEVLAEGTSPIEVLAYNQWPGLRASPALLATFVTPNHPVISKILLRVRDRLQKQSGNNAFNAYQERSPARVVAMVRALYESLQTFGISYAEPPASFEREGQKIRLADTVLAEQLATCIDITLLVASCLEQMRLAPILVLIEGHAFVGVWLIDERFPECIVGDAARLRTSVTLGHLAFFEATSIIADPPGSFEASQATAERHLADDDAFQFAIDVRVARHDRYRPLPLRAAIATELRTSHDSAEARTILREAQEQPDPEPPAEMARTPTPGPVDPVRARLRAWSDRLLDLSLRNRLLNFRAEAKSSIPLEILDAATFEDALASERSFDLLGRPVDERDKRSEELVQSRTDADEHRTRRLADQARGVIHSPLRENELRERAVHVDRAARLALEEGGANTLYAGVGLLRWYESSSSDTPRYAPLLLVPVALEHQRVSRRIRLRGLPDDASPNVTLVEKVRRDFAVDLSALANVEADDQGRNVTGMLHAVRQAIQRMPRWEVIDEVVLGLFTFSKFLMWRDLEDNAEALLASDVVRHIAQGNLGPFANPAPAVDPQTLDATRSEKLPLVVDADSTQMAAVASALDGRCFVLQGPPGTGKSQTITNLIAATLAAGKTALFISEKMAALEVVQRRLAQTGLEDFCLELHSNKAQKRAVVDSLGRSLARVPSAAPSSWEAQAARLAEERAKLNAYALALHAPRPLGESFFEASSRLLALGGAPAIRVQFTNIAAARAGDLARLLDAAAAYVASASALGVFTEQPYRDARLGPWSAEGDRALRQHLESAIAALTQTRAAAERLAASLGLVTPASLIDCRELHTLVREASEGALPGSLIDSTSAIDLATRGRAWGRGSAEAAQTRASLAVRWSDTLYTLDLDALSARFERWASAFFLFALLFLWGARSKLRSVARAALAANAKIAEDLRAARGVLQAEADLEREGDALAQALSGQWSTSAIEALEPLLTRAERLRGAIAAYSAARPGASLTGVIALTNPALSEERRRAAAEQARVLGEAVDAWMLHQSAALQLLVPAPGVMPEPSDPGYLDATMRLLARWHGGLADYRAACLLRASEAAFAAWSVAPIIEAHQSGSLPPEQLVAATERAFLDAWVASIRDSEPALRAFDGANHHRLVEMFRETDSAHLSAARQHVVERLDAKIPRVDGVMSEASETGKLQRELRKKARHMPVRRLLAELPALVPRLKPCLLMSPLSVAQYLPADGRKFDVVVFDEASQIGAHDAIGAIARGKQVVIVGDSKQLPPTTFFQRGTDDEAPVEDNDIVELESILDEAIASGIPEQMLGWHYRSRHHALIEFSNDHYYDGRLNVFPAARGHVADLGVSLHPVPTGFYDKARTRTNRVEAQELVHYLTGSLSVTAPGSRTFGVVTFSLAQQLLIEDLLDEARGKSPAVEAHFASDLDEPVFVKNLENVQGDERDEILFSVGYGPDADGRVWMNFGPLNRSGGERRLNVAITRARQKLRVFSTLTHEQIDLSRTKATGAMHLKAFLRFVAEQSGASDAGYTPRLAQPQGEFERQIAAALIARGHKIEAQVGCGAYRIDLAVVHPTEAGVYLLGIECDGKSYASAQTARDRDRLRGQVLRGLGWRLHRVWSSDWWFRRDHEVERLERAIASALSEPAPVAASPVAPAPERPSPEEAPAAALPPALELTPSLPVVAYERATIAPTGLSGAALYDASSTRTLRDRVRAVAMTEAPVHVDDLARRVGAAFGQHRLSERLRERTLEIVGALPELTVRGDFIWRTDQDPSTYDRVRGSDAEGDCRALEHIPLEELAAAAAWVLDRAMSTSDRDLARETLRLFGVQRATTKATDRVRESLELLRAAGRCTIDGDRVTIATGTAERPARS